MSDKEALKAAIDAQVQALLANHEYVSAVESVVEEALWGGAGLGVMRVSADGQIERIAPRDFFIEPKALEETNRAASGASPER